MRPRTRALRVRPLAAALPARADDEGCRRGIAIVGRAWGVLEGDIGTAAVVLEPVTRAVTRPDAARQDECVGDRAAERVSPRRAAMARLRRDAVRDCRSRAEALAPAVGIRIGPHGSLATGRLAAQASRFFGGSRFEGERGPIAAGTIDSAAAVAARFAVAP